VVLKRIHAQLMVTVSGSKHEYQEQEDTARDHNKYKIYDAFTYDAKAVVFTHGLPPVKG
jgi:hypothetical protein